MNPPLVEFDHVSFSYAGTGRGSRPFAVVDVTFDVGPEEVVGVIGPNSAGKTTLVRLLTGLVVPARGEVRLDGAPLGRLGGNEIARRVGVVPQELPQAFPFTVGDLVLMGRYPHDPGRFFESDGDREIAREAMAATGVLDLAEASVERLSGGERQRAVLARALAQRPRVLALDEPMAHLDLKHQAACAALLRRVSRDDRVGVLLISHDLNLAAELCDRLLLVAAGRVAAFGPPADVLVPDRLSSVFDCEVIVGVGPTGRPTVQVAWEHAVGDGRR